MSDEQHLHLPERAEESVLPRAHGLQGEAAAEAAPAEETAPEIAKRVLMNVRAAKDTLRRIMENEAPYLEDEKQ